MNLILCVVIVVLGIVSYRKKDSMISLYIGLAFGLFGISHLVTLLGYRDILEPALIWLRTVAYLVVSIAILSLAVD